LFPTSVADLSQYVVPICCSISAEHLVEAVVGGAPIMMGASAEQGEEIVDDEGWATVAV